MSRVGDGRLGIADFHRTGGEEPSPSGAYHAMKRRVLHPQQRFGHVNITPLIDVLMCLIVFYLIVGRLAADRLPAIEAPRALTPDAADAASDVIMTIRPTAGGDVEILINGVDAKPGEFESAIARALAEGGDSRVLIRADRRLSYGDVSPVIAASGRAGARAVNLAVEPAP